MNTAPLTSTSLYAQAFSSINDSSIYCELNDDLYASNFQKQVLVAGIISNQICNIALGLQSFLFIGELQIELQNSLSFDWLKKWYATLPYEALSSRNTEINYNINIRDFIKMVFAVLGIEVEFSGKNHYEKGVIIDVDEILAINLCLDLGALKQGQTVVKITPQKNQQNNTELFAKSTKTLNTIANTQTNFDLLLYAKSFILNNIKHTVQNQHLAINGSKQNSYQSSNQ